MANTESDKKKHIEKQYQIAVGVIFLLISFGVFYLHSTDHPLQNALLELYYIPVIIASIAFGWRWGLFYGIASSLITLTALFGIPDSPNAWVKSLTWTTSIRIASLIFIGSASGYVSHREKQREHGYRQLTQTIEAIRTPSNKKDQDDWLNQILDAAEAVLKPKSVETISVMLLDESEKYLRIVAARGIPDSIILTTLQPVGKGIGGYVMQSGKPLLCQDFGKFSDVLELVESERGVTSSICVPLISKDKPIGVLSASSHSRTIHFDEQDLAPFVILGHAVALTMENTELHKGLKSAYLQTIHSLARTINVKDKYTYDHSEKIAEYALAIANRFKFSEKEKEDLYAAALLHDIGKIGISDTILFKTGRLTPEEYEEVKKHAVLGLRILEPMEQMKNVANLVLHHQEKYDGSGYPDGLKGEEIPLGSRILSVVDAFHAMTSDRTYRKAIPFDEAKREMERYKGKQFDPKVVDEFFDILSPEEVVV